MDNNFELPLISSPTDSNSIALYDNGVVIGSGEVWQSAKPGQTATMDDPEGQKIFLTPDGDITE